MNKKSKVVTLDATTDTQVATLLEQNQQLSNSLNNTVLIANYAFSELSKIEDKLIGSPTIQKLIQNNKQINFWWILLNSSLVKDVIESIIEIIKRVKEKIKEIQEQAKNKAE